MAVDVIYSLVEVAPEAEVGDEPWSLKFPSGQVRCKERLRTAQALPPRRILKQLLNSDIAVSPVDRESLLYAPGLVQRLSPSPTGHPPTSHIAWQPSVPLTGSSNQGQLHTDRPRSGLWNPLPFLDDRIIAPERFAHSRRRTHPLRGATRVVQIGQKCLITRATRAVNRAELVAAPEMCSSPTRSTRSGGLVPGEVHRPNDPPIR